jgi:SulP family sulfate permease
MNLAMLLEMMADSGDDRVILGNRSDSHIWDASTVAAPDRVIAKYAHHGKTVELIGMNPASRCIHDDLAGHLAASR